MKLVRTAVRVVVKRPFVILFLGIVTLIYSVINYYNPLFRIFFGLNALTKGDFLESVVSSLQVISDPGIIPILMGLIFGIIVAASLFCGLVFSGYFNIINNLITGKAKINGEFVSGVKKYFIRISTISFRALFLGVLFLIFMMVATVPAIVITKAASIEKPELVAAAFFLDLLTAAVLFFGFLFFRVYVFFWYPAALNNDKEFFKAGKRAADRFFWKIAGRFLIFDLIFVGFQFLFLQLGDSIVVFTANWIFETVFLLFYITYIFYTYRFSVSKAQVLEA